MDFILSLKRPPLAKRTPHSEPQGVRLLDIVCPSTSDIQEINHYTGEEPLFDTQDSFGSSPQEQPEPSLLLPVQKQTSIKNPFVEEQKEDEIDLFFANMPNAVPITSNILPALNFEEPINFDDQPFMCFENPTMIEEADSSKLMSSQDKVSRLQQGHQKLEENWSMEDTSVLMKIALDLKLDWKKVAKKFNALTNKKATPNFLKLKYKANKPEYTTKNKSFSLQDDLTILKMFLKHGANFDAISKEINDNDSIRIRNRFYSHIKKKNVYEKLYKMIIQEQLKKKAEAESAENQGINI